MPTDKKFVIVPWGSNISGEEIWLCENALILGLETIFEKMGLAYADLSDQLGGEQKRSSPTPPFQEADLLALSSRAPADTSAIIDGLVNVILSPETGEIVAIEIAPRILELPARAFHLPDAFRFEAFGNSSEESGWFHVEDQTAWHALVIMVAEAVLSPFGLPVPASIGPETLQMSTSWPAYLSFIKGKRASRTVDEKLGYYRQASRLDPTFYWARFNAGQLFKQQQDYHSARREFLGAVDGAGDASDLLGDTYFELGLCSIFLGDTKTARNFWDQALNFAPNNPVLLVNVAGTYEQEENWDRAITLHRAALDINPNYYKALVSLARLKAQTGLIDEAIPLYEKALSIEPTDPLRYAILGGCYLSQGDEVKARAYFERASELDPIGSKKKIVIDEAEAPPAPGDYARQELDELDKAAEKRLKDEKGGWRWFGR